MGSSYKTIGLENILKIQSELQTELDSMIKKVIENHNLGLSATSEIEKISKVQTELEYLDRMIIYND
jgi:hypothetical protein